MKIKSKTDVITNSSSEVFIIRKEDMPKWTGNDGGCITTEELSLDFFDSEQEALCDLMHWDPKDTGGECIHDSIFGNYWIWHCNSTDLDSRGLRYNVAWKQWINDHKEEVEKRIEDLIWVDIEDHYADYEDDMDSARAVCIYSDYRH